MSFNGSGTFVINSAGQPVVANTVISATVFNALTADLATGLTNCITKDGQSTPTANIPMGNNKITGLGAGTAATDAATLGQVQSTAAKLISVTGTDTISGTMSPALTAYAAGQLFYFIANAANTGAMTINIDGLGAKNITRDGSTALVAGDVNSGEIVVICYDGTRFQMINAANSFGNTTINGTLTVTGKSDLPTVSTASINAAVAVVTTGTVTNLTATSASVASMNAGVALLTTATVTTLTATGASIASANIGNLQFTAASIASINAGVAVVTNLTATSASIASMNGSVASITTVNATTVNATTVEVTNVKANDGTAAITIADSTGAVTVGAGATINGGAVFNETGADVDFRIESDTNANAFVLDGATGNVGIGGTASAFDKVTVTGTLPTNSGTSIAFAARGTTPAGTTADYVGFNSVFSTAAASFTMLRSSGFFASQGTLGAGSAVTSQFGYRADSSLTGATNNYGFYSNIASGSGRYNFFANGSADNYFAGNTGIGGTSQRSPATRLTVVNSSATGSSAGVEIRSWGDAFNLLQTGASSSLVDNAAIIWNSWAASPIVFGTAGGSGGAFNERMRIDSEGRVGIGGTAGAEVKVHALGTYPTSGGYTRVFRATGTIPSGTTSSSGLSHITFQSFVSTQAASFTMPGLAHFQSEGVTIGAGSTVTNQYGFSVASTLTGATNNYGVYSNIASGANRWSFYSAGTAQNYFAGNTGVGTTNIGSVKFSVLSNVAAQPTVLSLGQNYTGLATDAQWYNANSVTSNTLISKRTDGGLWLYQSGADYISVHTNANERMRIDASGNVGIGTSSPTNKLHVVANATGGDGAIRVEGQYGSGYFGTFGSYPAMMYESSGLKPIVVYDTNNSATILYTSATERMRIDTSGNVGIGGTAAAATKLNILGTLPTSGTVSFGVGVTGTIPSGSTSGGYGFSTGLNTEAASFTLGELRHFSASQATIGAGSTVTNQFGFIAGSNLTGATNNFGFYSDIASGSGRWNLYCAGSALNYMAGALLIGATTTGSYFDGVLNAVRTTGSGAACSLKQETGSLTFVQTIWNNATTSDNAFVAFVTETSPTVRGSIDYDRTGGLVRYNTTSDYRAKTITGPVTNSGKLVDALKVYVGKMNGATAERQMLIAHEAQEVAPYAVSGEKDAVDKDGNPVYQQIDTSSLVPLLIAEIQSLRQRVAELEAK